MRIFTGILNTNMPPRKRSSKSQSNDMRYLRTIMITTLLLENWKPWIIWLMLHGANKLLPCMMVKRQILVFICHSPSITCCHRKPLFLPLICHRWITHLQASLQAYIHQYGTMMMTSSLRCPEDTTVRVPYHRHHARHHPCLLICGAIHYRLHLCHHAIWKHMLLLLLLGIICNLSLPTIQSSIHGSNPLFQQDKNQC